MRDVGLEIESGGKRKAILKKLESRDEVRVWTAGVSLLRSASRPCRMPHLSRRRNFDFST